MGLKTKIFQFKAGYKSRRRLRSPDSKREIQMFIESRGMKSETIHGMLLRNNQY